MSVGKIKDFKQTCTDQLELSVSRAHRSTVPYVLRRPSKTSWLLQFEEFVQRNLFGLNTKADTWARWAAQTWIFVSFAWASWNFPHFLLSRHPFPSACFRGWQMHHKVWQSKSKLLGWMWTFHHIMTIFHLFASLFASLYAAALRSSSDAIHGQRLAGAKISRWLL